MLRLTTLLLFAALGSGVALAEEDIDFARIEELAKAAPRDVARFITRKLECFHWAGEEPYDKARAREISMAFKRLNCDGLERDEAALRRVFAQDPKALTALDEARTLPF